jgi:hypothetical protein
MDTKQKQRLRVIKQIEQKKLNLKDAARVLGVSYRQARRIYKAYRLKGEASLIHGLVGRVSNRRLDADFRALVLKYYREYFADFGPSLAMKGLRCMGYNINRETFRRWLLEEKLWKITGKGKQRRKTRGRNKKIYFGQKLHLVSCNYRLSGRQEKTLPLLMIIDDLTKIRLCHVGDDSEKRIMQILRTWVERYGVPRSVFCDLPVAKKKTDGVKPYGPLKTSANRSAFARACKKLKIEIQAADTPELEKHLHWCYEIYRDYVQAELKGITAGSLPAVKARLQKKLNEKYGKASSTRVYKGKDFHTKLKAQVDLNTIFCYEYKRPVSDEWVVEHNNRLYYISEQDNFLSQPQATEVRLAEWLDGSVHIYYKNKELKIEERRVKN